MAQENTHQPEISKLFLEAIAGGLPVQNGSVELAGRKYEDVVVHNGVSAVRAYIQCSWFSPEEIDFMEKGLKVLGQNPSVSLQYSHHPLSHQYNDIDVNEHPEVMGDREWQQNTYQMDMHAMYGMEMGIGLFMPSKPDVGQTYEQGVLYALHKPNILIIPDDEKDIPLNLMVGCGNTRIITLSEARDFDFHDVMFKPYDGKVF